MVNTGPVFRSEIPASDMTIGEAALLQIYIAMLNKGSGTGAKAALEKAQDATAYYLQSINGLTKFKGEAIKGLDIDKMVEIQ